MAKPPPTIGNWARVRNDDTDSIWRSINDLVATHRAVDRYRMHSVDSLLLLMKDKNYVDGTSKSRWNGHIWKTRANDMSAFFFLRSPRPWDTRTRTSSNEGISYAVPPAAYCLTVTQPTRGNAIINQQTAQQCRDELNALCMGLTAADCQIEILSYYKRDIVVNGTTLACPTDNGQLVTIWQEAAYGNMPFIEYQGLVQPPFPEPFNPKPPSETGSPHRWKLIPR